MKYVLLCTLIFATAMSLAISALATDNSHFVWAKAMGGSSGEYGSSIYLDDSGNIYTTGGFQGTVDFDPGTEVFNLTSAGGSDIFFSKLDTNGNFLWAKAMGGAGEYNSGQSIYLDNSDNVYVAGRFSETVDFDPGQWTFNLTSTGNEALFISKLDSNANFLWAKAILQGPDWKGLGGVTMDDSGNVYIIGSFKGTADFDAGPAVFNLTSAGGWDIFISKYDTNGNFLWAKAMGGAGEYDNGSSIYLDDSGNIYTTGGFQGTADFDAGPAIFNLTSAGDSDIFFSKLDNNGNFLWANAIGGAYRDAGKGLSVDESGNIYIIGDFKGTVDFDPSGGVLLLTSASESDLFVCKLDNGGNLTWAKAIGGISSPFTNANELFVESTGNIYITGYFEGTVDFDPSTEVFNLTSASKWDIFISKLDNNGNFLWAKAIGGEEGAFNSGNSIYVDDSGYVYTTGSFAGTADFDPGAEVFNLTSAGEMDIFISKLGFPTTLNYQFPWSMMLPAIIGKKGQFGRYPK